MHPIDDSSILGGTMFAPTREAALDQGMASDHSKIAENGHGHLRVHDLIHRMLRRLHGADTLARTRPELDAIFPVLLNKLPPLLRYEEALLTLFNPTALAAHAADHIRLLSALRGLHDIHRQGGTVSIPVQLNLVCFVLAHQRTRDAGDFHFIRSRPPALLGVTNAA